VRLLAPAIFLVASAPASAPADDRATQAISDRNAFLISFENLAGVTYDGQDGRRALHHVGLGSTLGPRIGVHGLFGGGLTLGGVLATLATYDEGRTRTTAVFFGPRAGLWLSGRVVGVWPRAGVNVVGTGRNAYLSWTLEAPITLHVTSHVVLLVGPLVERQITEVNRLTYLNVSLTAGLMGAF
jgi:hypothetical protein